jgi:nucleoid-associated protein YgaU
VAAPAPAAAAQPGGEAAKQSAAPESGKQEVAAAPALPTPSANDVVVPQIQTTTVVRGDSLWRISRKILGHGIRYTLIYEANADQIRDPSLIYPGQVFVLPHMDN